MQKQYKLAVYIGRYEPFHNGHLNVGRDGLELADKVLFLCGSSNTPPTIKNPFSFEQRAEMIIGAFPEAHAASRIGVAAINDYSYDENKWLAQIQEVVAIYEHEDSEIVLLGYQRDDSSYYLHNFPKWATFFSDEHHHYNEPINGTELRNAYFKSAGQFFRSHNIDMLPESTINEMKSFAFGEVFYNLAKEWQFIMDYRKAWECAPYPPIFVTTDACVIQSGHVLLIQRGAAPGLDLWAMPGGFLEAGLDLEDNSIKELREETKLKVPEKVLRGSNTYTKVFDSPRRSERGRTITHTYMYELDDASALPRVKGADDAKDADWFTFAQVEQMATVMYEDHWHMVMHMINRSK